MCPLSRIQSNPATYYLKDPCSLTPITQYKTLATRPNPAELSEKRTSIKTLTESLLNLITTGVKQRVDYKLTTIVYKSLRGQTPSYLVDDCQPIADSGRRQLRSADANVLSVPRTHSRLGDRRFSVAGPRVWNSLPASLWQPDVEFGQFKGTSSDF